MATQKKKHLIELMIEAGVKWPKGAECASQDKRDRKVNFYKDGKPRLSLSNNAWVLDSSCSWLGPRFAVALPSICRNWHQTIVTREQYAEAMDAVTPDVQREAQPEPKYCASVTRQMPDNTIEQLTADYHAKSAEAARLQAVADEALKAADDALLALEKAGELIGLAIYVDAEQKQSKQDAQPEITDWRDLRIGDVIECVLVCGKNGVETNQSNNRFHGLICNVIGFTDSGLNHILTDLEPSGYYIQEFKFIRRP